MQKFKLANYDILTNGSDGGHNYLSTELKFKGRNRKLIVLFENKKDEIILLQKKELIVFGDLEDDNINSLILSNAKIIVK